jgi:murein DD-endopeptidase MepM/ murein hydrolase activator NlpD/Ca2+-binding RTX toxin-like protein
LCLEELEPRLAPATNLTITAALLVDGNNNPITAPVIGQEVFVRAEWETTDLNASQQYVVRYLVDGVPLDSATQTGQAGQNLTWNWYRSGWYASPGPHTVQVTVDGANTIAESSESDNTRSFTFSPVSPSDLPSKFLWPMGGHPNSSSVNNYVDVNPLADQLADFRGGPYTYDGHNAFDISLANFKEMDAGVPVFAAAAGTVSETQDGNFDRQTSFDPDVTGAPANYVIIDHGNGWESFYWHLARNTITVKPGQVVAAGQLLGLAGSSGNSSGAHLHFNVTYREAEVETMYAPGEYFATPPTYQANLPTKILDHGITNYDVTADIDERPSEIRTFATSSTESVRFWARNSHFNPNDDVRLNWVRPGGVVHLTGTFTPTEIVRYGYRWWSLAASDWSQFPGTWAAIMTVNGSEVARDSFEVTTGAGAASIRVSQGTTYIVDGRTTPIDFGSIPTGVTTSRTITVANHGSAPLTLSNLVLPPGFSLQGAFPSSVNAGASASFTVQLNSTVAGRKFGTLQFNTNDPEEGVFNFNFEGNVTGTAPAGAPVLALPNPALAYGFNQAAQVFDATATFTDGNSPNLIGGSLTVEFASGGTPDDRLGIQNQGTGAGQIGVNGSSVTFGGITIGTFTGGTGTTTLVINFNAAATPAAVQALLRNITFSNTSATPSTAARHARFSAVDDTGLASTMVVKTVVLAPGGASTSPGPTVTVNQASGQADPANAAPINFTVVFSEVVTGFTDADVTLGGTAGATTAVVTGSGTTYNVAVSGMTASGTVIASVAAGVATNGAGNTNLSSTSTDNSVTFEARPPLTTGPVVGTEQDDTILLTVGTDNFIEVRLNGVFINRVDPGALASLAIEGRGGNDNIDVAENVLLPVSVLGGAGNDTLIGGAGNDTILGGAGDDLMFGRAGNDQVFGEDGNDAIDAQDGNDSLGGGFGNDLMFGSAGTDLMFGEAGNDGMDGGADNDNMDGGVDDDLIFGSDGSDLLFGGDGNDAMDGGLGNDSMDGGAGHDVMFGFNGNDVMYGLAGNDSMDAGSGNDSLDAGSGNDLVFGSFGNDLIFGSAGNDAIDGNDGQDSIDAGDGHDLVFGSGGSDLIFGGFGNDSIDGGTGLNSIDGGPGFNLIFQ